MNERVSAAELRSPGSLLLPTAILTAILAASLLAVACGSGDRATPSSESERLHALFATEWEFRIEQDPLLATSVGDHRFDDRLPHVTPQAMKARAAAWQGMLDQLEQMDRQQLTAADRINARIFERQLRFFVRNIELGGYELPIDADSGFHMEIARLHRTMPLRTVRDYDNYLSRLEAAPRYFQEQIANLRAGLERGFSQPRRSMLGYQETMALHVVDRAEDSVFWIPFASLPTSIAVSEHQDLRARGQRAVLEGVVPAYRALHDFFVGEYLPSTRSTVAALELPNGREYYQEQVRWYTTLDLSPEQIHQIGLEEVARIRGEMRSIIERIGFGGTFAEFLGFLRSESRFYAPTPEQLLKEAAYIAKRMDGKLPSLFRTLPRLPYTVEPVPPHIAPKYTSARYVEAPHGSTEPGIYWLNTTKLESRPLYTLESLTLHESVPGHHLQSALASELEGLPPFRRFSYISAFGEGWGLYSEWLGLEAGFYQDPYSDFGRLTYEMWRACRLVVDTGVHVLGWSRDQMLDYLSANTALSQHEIETETDRYITWPGQALSYKLGELEIKRLRKRAEEALGSGFDVRDFHDAVLLEGAIPLDVLADQVEAYIVQMRADDGS